MASDNASPPPDSARAMVVSYIGDHLFIDGINCRRHYGPYVQCTTKGCPFRVKVSLSRDEESGRERVGRVEGVVFGIHWHRGADDTESSADLKRRLLAEIDAISRNAPGSDELRRQFEEMARTVQEQSERKVQRLQHLLAVGEYGEKHRSLSGSAIKRNLRSDLHPAHILTTTKRRMRKDGIPTSVGELLEKRHHLVLGAVDEDIIVFGRESSIKLLAAAPLIQADGTFTCCLPGFSQLYVIHANINNVAVPALFCLLRGKDAETYNKLLNLLEAIANERGLTILNRPVEVVCDFEAAFLRQLRRFPLVRPVGCFFHFAHNMEKHADKLFSPSDPAACESARVFTRRMSLLPLLPPGLITQDLLADIERRCTDAAPSLSESVRAFLAYFTRTYLSPSAPFPLDLWSVSGRRTRTNNAAESFHSRLNERCRRAMTLGLFLSNVEESLGEAAQRVAAGCQSRSKKVNGAKNELLRRALRKLLAAELDPLAFLDACGRIVQLQTVAAAEETKALLRCMAPVDRDWAQTHSLALCDARAQLAAALSAGESARSVPILRPVLRDGCFVRPSPRPVPWAASSGPDVPVAVRCAARDEGRTGRFEFVVAAFPPVVRPPLRPDSPKEVAARCFLPLPETPDLPALLDDDDGLSLVDAAPRQSVAAIEARQPRVDVVADRLFPHIRRDEQPAFVPEHRPAPPVFPEPPPLRDAPATPPAPPAASDPVRDEALRAILAGSRVVRFEGGWIVFDQ